MIPLDFISLACLFCLQGDSGDATDDEMVCRKARSCKEGHYRNGPESDGIEQEDAGDLDILNSPVLTF